MERKVIIRNVVCSLLLQFVTIISGFVVPKVILNYFGSNVNGLISSVNQFLNYIQLLEGGLSSVIMAALYKPLAEKNVNKISSIVNATQLFFKRISIIFVAYMLGVAFIYPIFVDTGFTYAYSLALVIVLGSHLFVQYFFSLTLKLLLNADRKVYIVSITQIIIILSNMIAVVAFAKLFSDVLLIKIASAIIFLIQPVIYGRYVKKHYSIDKTVSPDNAALSQRWSGFGINLAYFIHTNTDVIILTFFSSLANISVYAVYLLVVNAMKNLVVAVSQAVTPSLGKSIATDNIKTANDKFELYEFGMFYITTIIFTCGVFLITPFIRVYTSNIHDADYEQYLFGYILTIAEMVYCYRDPYVSVSYAAGHFKQVTKYAIIEVIINLVLSIALVHNLGIVGVAIGTLISMVYRTIAHIYYLRENILMRKISIAIKKFLVFGLSFIITIVGCNLLFVDKATGYLSWVVLGIKTFIICLSVSSLLCYIFYREMLEKLVLNRLKSKERKV